VPACALGFVALASHHRHVIIAGHDSTVQGHHIFYVNPHGATPSKVYSIAKIAAPAVYLLGGSSAVDWDAKVCGLLICIWLTSEDDDRCSARAHLPS
jgi:hypothetical protein